MARHSLISKGTMAPEVQKELFYEEYSDKEIASRVYGVWQENWVFDGENKVRVESIDREAIENLIQYIKELRDNG